MVYVRKISFDVGWILFKFTHIQWVHEQHEHILQYSLNRSIFYFNCAFLVNETPYKFVYLEFSVESCLKNLYYLGSQFQYFHNLKISFTLAICGKENSKNNMK